MSPPPKNISVFPPGSEEFVAFCVSACPEHANLDGGMVIKYAPAGWLFKIGTIATLLFLSFGLFFYPDKGQWLFNPAYLGTVFLAVLCVGIKGRFDETWFLLTKEKLFIRRWKYILPGYNITVFERKSIRSVECRTNPRLPKSPTSYTLQFIVKEKPGASVNIMWDTNWGRITWLTKVVAAWRENRCA